MIYLKLSFSINIVRITCQTPPRPSLAWRVQRYAILFKYTHFTSVFNIFLTFVGTGLSVLDDSLSTDSVLFRFILCFIVRRFLDSYHAAKLRNFFRSDCGCEEERRWRSSIGEAGDEEVRWTSIASRRVAQRSKQSGEKQIHPSAGAAPLRGAPQKSPTFGVTRQDGILKRADTFRASPRDAPLLSWPTPHIGLRPRCVGF